MTPAGRARHEIKIANHDLADIDRMERVHVLFGSMASMTACSEICFGTGIWAQDARNCRALVQLRNQAEQFLLRGLFGKRVLRCKSRTAFAGAPYCGRKSRSPDRCRR